MEPTLVYPNSSELMEDYRFGSEITTSTSITQLVNAEGESELFYADSVLPLIYNVSPDSDSDTGWSVMTISCDSPLAEQPFTGGSSGGVFTLVSVGPDTSNPEIIYTQRDSAGVWSAWQVVDASSVNNQLTSASVKSIAAEVVDGVMELAAVLSEGQSSLGIWQISGWSGSNPTWQRLGSVEGSFLDVCKTASWGEGVLGVRGNPVTIANFDLFFFPFDGTPAHLLASNLSQPFIDSARQKSAAGISSGIFIYQLDPDTSTGSVSFVDCSVPSPEAVLIDTTLICTRIVAVDSGANSIFMASLDNAGLLHILVPAETASGWEAIELGEALSTISAGLAAGGAPLIFGVAAQGNALRSLLQQPETLGGEWTTQEIAAQRSVIEKVTVYGTTFTLVDAQQNRLANPPVSVTSGENLTFESGQQSFAVGPAAPPAVLTTNAAGQVTLYAPTGTINGAKLLFSSEGITPAGQLVAIDVDDPVRQKLQNLTVEQVQQLVPVAYAQDAAQVHQALQQAMSYTSVGMPVGGRRTRYVSADGFAGYERPIDARSGRVDNWSFTVRSGRATFTELTAGDAATLHATLLGGGVMAADLGGFFDWLGDIIDAVVNAIETAFTYVVSVVEEVVKATIKCVIDGVTYAFQGVIDTIERAFEVAESIFSSVGVFFEKLFSTLGWLLSNARTDIWNTKLQFEQLINQSFTGLTSLCQHGETAAGGFFADLRTSVAAKFDTAIASVGNMSFDVNSLSLASPSPAGLGSSPSDLLDVLADGAVTINWLFDKVSSALGVPDLAPSLPQSVTDAVETLSVKLGNTLGADIQSQITALQDYFLTIAGDPANFIGTTLKAVLTQVKLLVLDVLDVLDAVTQFFFEAAIAFLGAAKADVFDQNIGGFLLGPLYNLINPGQKEDLTLTRLVALVAAFPSTILYCLINGADNPPFSSGVAGEPTASGSNTWKQMAGLITCRYGPSST
jgi:hypothetical protein